MQLGGARVLDIGCSDGLVSFGVKQLGAGPVQAVDSYRNRSFFLARRLLGYSEGDIDYQHGLQIKDLADRFDPAQFDVVVCAGVFYHMLHPMQAFTECRKLLGEGGYLILETPYDTTRDDAVLVFNGTAHLVNEPFTYFVPTRSALLGMATLSGYRLIATRLLRFPERITLLFQAVSRDVVVADASTPPFVTQMLKRDLCDESFRYRYLEAGDKRRAVDVGIDVAELGAERTITAQLEAVTFPFHPPAERPVFGSTRFENVGGNTDTL